MATILIVDDRAVNRQYLVTLLGYCGHRTLEAADGAEGLAMARMERPELVITDIVMPTMDGAEMVHALRADPALASTAVIFYSASYREKEARAVATACGVSLVLSKPADPELVLQFVNLALGSRAVSAEIPAGVRPPGPDLGLLTDALSKRLSEQQRAAARLAIIIELGLDLASVRDSVQLTRIFSKGARDIVTARFASVGLFCPEGSALAHFCIDGLVSEDAARLPAPFPLRGQLAELLKDGKPRRLSGTLTPADFGLPDAHLSWSSLLGVAVATARRTYGWLCFCNKVGATEFSAEDERLAITLAAQLAVAYENILLLAKAEQDTETLRLQASALAAAANAIMITDRDGMIVWANPALARLTGYPVEDLIGQNPRLFKSDQQDVAIYKQMWESILAGQVWSGELVNQRPDGSSYVELMTITPVGDSRGDVTHFIAVKQDITERKRTEKALARRAAEMAQFNAAAVGRELRMIELKQEVNDLARLLGKPQFYDMASLNEVVPNSQGSENSTGGAAAVFVVEAEETPS